MYIRHLLADWLINISEKKFGSKHGSILMYHSVGSNGHFFTVKPEVFEWQLIYLSKSDYIIVPLADIMDKVRTGKQIPEKTVAITFDDGYVDNYYTVFPTIRKYNIPISIFIPVDFIGKKRLVRGVRMEHMSWPQIREMHDSGIVDFEPHAKTHAKLTEMPIEQARKEIVGSKDEIDRILSKSCRYFSYPFGAYNSDILSLVEKNFIGAVSATRGFVGSDSNLFTLPRQSVDSSVDRRRFKLKL